MSRNTFKFSIKGEAVREGKLPGINGLCQGKTAELDGENETEGAKKRMMMLLVNCWDCD